MTPTSDDLIAYREGRLELTRFEAVDAWITAQSPEEQARLLGTEEPVSELKDTYLSSSATIIAEATSPSAFTPEGLGPERYRIDRRLGAGGMGIVESAFDTVLGREVALKRCRSRRVDETIASYAARLRTFRREAAITAQLEHPGIVPVHDVGVAALGEPAFVMKRLDGNSLTTLVARQLTRTQPLDLARLAELMLRITEAIAYAHRRGVVHRDLKPDNVIVGSLGAIYVIDWGLAGVVSNAAQPTNPTGLLPRTANQDSHSTIGTYRLGTPGWMAPEQFHGAPADPRMDVFALGGLLMALLTGHGPRSTNTPTSAVAPSRSASDQSFSHGLPANAIDVTPLQNRNLPRGLVAVALHCLQSDPQKRYADGRAVAEELRRWLSAGITQAEKAGVIAYSLARIRRSPRLLAASFGVVMAAGLTISLLAVQRANERIKALTEAHDLIADLDLTNENAVHHARTQIDYLLRSHPDLRDMVDVRTRLSAVEDAFRAQKQLETDRMLLREMQRQYRVQGPWQTEIADLHKTLSQVGYPLDHTGTINPLSYAERLRDDRLAEDVLTTLTQLYYAYVIEDIHSPFRDTIPQLIAKAGPTVAWRAMGDVLAQVTAYEHDLVFCHCPAASVVLTSATTTDLVLAGYGPEPRLIRAAWERWHEDSAAFWPRIMAGRSSLQRGEWRLAERHALVALGSEPDSLWPHLILAYVALADQEWESLLREASAGRIENHDHLELVVLCAIGLARLGHLDQAQAIINQRDCAATLRYHLVSTSGHPLNLATRALIEAGVKIAKIPPHLGPLVRRPIEP